MKKQHTKKQIDISTREDGGWRRMGNPDDWRKVDARIVPRRVIVNVGELRIEGGPHPLDVKIFLDGKELGNSRDAKLLMPLLGTVSLEVELVLRLAEPRGKNQKVLPSEK